jgi:ABC-type antimicrobial peptide transport system permease subunit
LVGCAIAYEVLAVVGSSLLFQGRVTIQLTPMVAIGSIGLAAAIGLVSAAVPGLNATRRDIATALRAIV